MRNETEKKIKRRDNRGRKKNQATFGVLLIVLHIVISGLYAYIGNVNMGVLDLGSVLTAIFIAMLSIVGFGMHFGYLKHLLWTSMGYSLIITAVSIVLYPLANALWAKLQINSNINDSFDNRSISIHLASNSGDNYQNNTITAAMKCAISIIIAFGSVIGRVGPLETLILAVVGVTGYELNRNFVVAQGQDMFGTFLIFAFGGFLGLTFGIFTTIYEKKKKIQTFRSSRLQGIPETIIHSIFGNLVIFILLPFLAFEGDQSLEGTDFQKYIAPVGIILSMGSAIVTSIALAMLIHGDNTENNVRITDILNAQIAGGIVSGAASYYMTTPYLGIITGVTGGACQYFFDNYIEKKIYKKWGIVSTYSFSLFCFQSLIGSIFAFIYDWSSHNNGSSDFIFTSWKNDGEQLISYCISSGMGIGCGMVVGAINYFVNSYRKEDLFHDKTEFLSSDGISFPKESDAPQTDGKIAQKTVSVINKPNETRKNIIQPQIIIEQEEESIPQPPRRINQAKKTIAPDIPRLIPTVKISVIQSGYIDQIFKPSNLIPPHKLPTNSNDGYQVKVVIQMPDFSQFSQPQQIEQSGSFGFNDMLSAEL